MRSITRGAALLLALLACAAEAHAQANFTRIFTDLAPSESQATALRVAGNGDNRFYRVEQIGRIRSFERDPLVVEAPDFLDITDRVYYAQYEPGLLGLAFHPNYSGNGYFYVTYITDDGDGPFRWRLSRFSRDDAPSEAGGAPTADPDSEVILLDLEKAHLDHNGGDLHFGPDGYLYVTVGDGHCCSDPFDHAQDRTVLFGKFLRLDVDDPAPGLNYGIPSDNPFVGNTQGWREEIWAYGFRNPWRFSIDHETAQVWTGDVGDWSWEEVNLVEAGGNYGWDHMEGPECYEEPDCDPSEYILPVWSYDRTVGTTVIGGHVYRGADLPALYGRYVFADWTFRTLWMLAYDPGSGEPPEITTLAEEMPFFPTGFAEDEDGEIYSVDTFSGAIYQLTPAEPNSVEPDAPSPEAPALRLWPNPAASALEVRAPLGEETVAVYDMLGRLLTEAPLQPTCFCARIELDLDTFPAGVYVARAGAYARTFTVVR